MRMQNEEFQHNTAGVEKTPVPVRWGEGRDCWVVRGGWEVVTEGGVAGVGGRSDSFIGGVPFQRESFT